MTIGNRFSCVIPEDGPEFLVCSLSESSAVEWVSAAGSLFAVGVAVAAAWLSMRIARQEKDRANRAEQRALEERLGNDVIAAFAEIEDTILDGEPGSLPPLYEAVHAFKSSLDDSNPVQKSLIESLDAGVALASEIEDYGILQKFFRNGEISEERIVSAAGIIGSLVRAIRLNLHEYMYTNNDIKKGIAVGELGRKVEKLNKDAAFRLKLTKP